jgi:lysophospholipase L1-like esterase
VTFGGGAVSAAAQEPAAIAPPAGPSLLIEDADLSQVGDDVRLRLRFSRDLPAGEIDRAGTRFVCLVLGPDAPTRRRVCVSRSAAGELRATLSAIDEAGRPRGNVAVLPRKSFEVDGAVLVLRAPAAALRIRLGAHVDWRVFVTWKDGGPCERIADPQACTQIVPATGTLRLRTRARLRPDFVRNGHLRVLATGDSMIQIVDGILARRLERRRGARVHSDAHISTGVSKLFMLDWVKRAREQARSLHPDVTVMFIGANDGFPMKTRGGATAACCAASWIAEYARRVESMLRSYVRGGRSYLYWLTLPAPRRGDFARVYRAVNRAVKRAADRVGRGARVIDLVKVFTPGGRFRQQVRFRGKTIDARQPDGVHLSVAGAAVAATLVVDRLQADRALPRLR